LNLYFTNARAQAAVVSQSISGENTTTAPFENAVFQVLATKADTANVYTKTQLDNGQLDSRYYTETQVDTLVGGKANVDNAVFMRLTTISSLAVHGNVFF